MTRSSYELSDWLEYLSHKEIDALKELATLLPKDCIVVNIGAGCGTSALALLESRPDLTLYTIDIRDESSPLGCLEGELIAIKDSGVDYEGRYFQICGDSKKVGKSWGKEVDMVFVDGDHSYDGCKGDIEAWLPWTESIMVFHDYKKTEKPHPGVDEAVMELMFKYPIAGLADTMIAFYV